MERKTFSFILISLIFVLALFFRIYFVYDRVFSEPIKYAADDGIYHMRLVENELLGNHFPHRIYFDPYTYFPNGAYVLVAPLYSKLLVLIIWLISFGKPSLELINKIAPFYPAVLGSLMVFVVYFIGKSLWGKKIGLFSAFLMAISPPYLFRSLLGATDQHVAEVLFSALVVMFLILALKVKTAEPRKNKKFWLFTYLIGFSLGLYFLNWSGAVLFLFIIFTFITLYYLISYLFGNSQEWILFMGIVVFLIVLIMIFLMYGKLFFSHPDFLRANKFIVIHLESIILGILGFIFMGAIARFLRKKKPWLFPIFLTFAGILGFGVLRFVFPSLFEGLVKSFQAVKTGMVPYEVAREIVGEMAPLGFKGVVSIFSSLFYFSLAALVIIFYRFIKNRKPEYLLILVWTIVIILITGIIPFFGMGRFAYYLACNISLLSGFLIIRTLEFGWRGLKIAQKIPLKSSVQPYFLVGSLFIIFGTIFFLLYPFPFNIGDSFPQNLPAIIRAPIEAAKSPVIRGDDWYDALIWLKENTPHTGVDYYGFYEGPGINKETGEANPYPYPLGAYGVLASWDVGHMITYYAQRIPNSSNFQQGIGKIEGEELKEVGEAVFFLETDEQKAVSYLDQLKTRYIITDDQSAHPKGVFKTKIKWLEGDLDEYSLEGKDLGTEPNKYDNSMVVRLHILDGKGEIIEREADGEQIEIYIKPLDHFRLIYESVSTVIVPSRSPNDDIKAVKIFEYVKGAKIVGYAEAGTEVTISTEIETNQGRKFIYQKSAKAENGKFEFIVSYSTYGRDGRLEGETQFAVFAGPYKLKIGNKEIEINVIEEDVLKGKAIEVSDID